MMPASQEGNIFFPFQDETQDRTSCLSFMSIALSAMNDVLFLGSWRKKDSRAWADR